MVTSLASFICSERILIEGNIVTAGTTLSDSYGNLRHMASILVENHSLKPFKQRVLDVYPIRKYLLSLLKKENY
jgi:hypothetical protein